MRSGGVMPFSAIVGQEQAKEALLLAVVNPSAGGILLSGDKGSAKSTLVRSLGILAPELGLRTLPLHITEDRLFGSLDWETALETGKERLQKGLLTEADGCVLYVDEVNLLRSEVIGPLLDAALSGCVRIEREGLSQVSKTSFCVVGTMNPEEGTLPDALLDRFGLMVSISAEKEAPLRAQIVKQVLRWEREPEQVAKTWEAEERHLRDKILQARECVCQVEVSAAMMELAAAWCSQGHCAGHRGELFLLEAAKSAAALDERLYVLPKDMEKAALYVLPHRVRQQQEPPMSEENQGDSQQEEEPPENEQSEQEKPPELPQDPETDADKPAENEKPPEEETPENEQKEQDKPPEPDSEPTSQEKVDLPLLKGLMQMKLEETMDRRERAGNGKRSRTRSSLKQGRYVRAIFPNGKVSDLAFDATLRAAAPWQKKRASQGVKLVIKTEDLRQKVRETRVGGVFFFVVDASGSMGAKKRMAAVKGAILSFLQDAYQKRDRVALVAFRRHEAEMLLPVTRSLDLARKCLQQLPTGGRTPLAAALETTAREIECLRLREKESRPVIVLVTDGRANSGGADPVQEARDAAEKLGNQDIPALVIDTEEDFVRMGIAKEIALRLQGTYRPLRSIESDGLVRILRSWRTQREAGGAR
ncbi:VWA domain-containing protein [Anaeromusa acidaminophila]|uniref:VWA domain-containing protein n=1 Tax=Anaeromusa acidaminophila TaxID=81464 RepID=UPI000362DFEB|nr:VWA domain-containing protein [Anaeromusa acidaminophila]